MGGIPYATLSVIICLHVMRCMNVDVKRRILSFERNHQVYIDNNEEPYPGHIIQFLRGDYKPSIACVRKKVG